jgi:hypothetical protein
MGKHSLARPLHNRYQKTALNWMLLLEKKTTFQKKTPAHIFNHVYPEKFGEVKLRLMTHGHCFNPITHLINILIRSTIAQKGWIIKLLMKR